MEVDFKSVNKAFSKQSYQYDEEDEGNAILQWMRKLVRGHVSNFIKPSSRMLELNAGTGIDAFYFSSIGHSVHATDLSDGMIKAIEEKIDRLNSGQLLTCEQCSYTELNKINKGSFDYIFSNFGGLNCIPDLHEVTKNLPALLAPGAYVTFVIMPPVCPWEMLYLLKGNFKMAFRRFKKGGAQAHLEGEHFQTYYFTPSEVIKMFGKDFKKISLQGLGSISPPPHNVKFQRKFPRVYTTLAKMDEKISLLCPFNRWADHFILTMRYLPKLNK